MEDPNAQSPTHNLLITQWFSKTKTYKMLSPTKIGVSQVGESPTIKNGGIHGGQSKAVPNAVLDDIGINVTTCPSWKSTRLG